MEWSTNHNGDHYVKYVPMADAANIEAATPVITTPGGTGTLTVPTTPGSYLVQYSWNNYRNCFELVVGSENSPVTGGPETGPTGPVDCATFCEDYMKQCTKVRVPDHYFETLNDCLTACAQYPNLQTDKETLTGNSLQCRMHHLHVEDSSTEHCLHASYGGGGVCVGGDYAPGMSFKVTFEAGARPSEEEMQKVADKLLNDEFDSAQYNVVATANGGDEMVVIVTFHALEGFTPEVSMKVLEEDNYYANNLKKALPGVKSVATDADIHSDEDVNGAGSLANTILASFAGFGLLAAQ
jgi:hypothetical protein